MIRIWEADGRHDRKKLGVETQSEVIMNRQSWMRDWERL